MEEDIETSSGASMVPIALALLAIVLGGAGLYFGMNANQRINPLADSVDEGTTSSARFDKKISALETRLAEVAAKNDELKKKLSRTGLYISQNEKGVKSNREELVKLAGKMQSIATSGSGTRAPTASSQTASKDAAKPTATAPKASTGSATTYSIRSGDTFGKIAKDKDVSLNALLDANPDADPRRLSIGQKINIPAQ